MRRRQQGVRVHRLPTGREIDDYVFGDAWLGRPASGTPGGRFHRQP